VFYCTCNHIWNWNKTISAAEGVLKLFQNYFRDIEHAGKYSLAAIDFGNNFEIMSGKFISDRHRRRLKWFWHNFISNVTIALSSELGFDIMCPNFYFVLVLFHIIVHFTYIMAIYLLAANMACLICHLLGVCRQSYNNWFYQRNSFL